MSSIKAYLTLAHLQDILFTKKENVVATIDLLDATRIYNRWEKIPPMMEGHS